MLGNKVVKTGYALRIVSYIFILSGYVSSILIYINKYKYKLNKQLYPISNIIQVLLHIQNNNYDDTKFQSSTQEYITCSNKTNYSYLSWILQEYLIEHKICISVLLLTNHIIGQVLYRRRILIYLNLTCILDYVSISPVKASNCTAHIIGF